MKNHRLIMTVSLIIVLITSCDEPELVVTNIVHPDGSVTRKVDMTSTKNNFDASKFQVPVDGTWSVRDSLSVSQKGDTTWYRTAEKLFSGTAEINKAYEDDTATNSSASRHVAFEKRFRWFNTRYRFSEVVRCRIDSLYPVSDFLGEEELNYFYSPDYMKLEKFLGPDSIKYKQLEDTIESRTEEWFIHNFARVWIRKFVQLTGPAAGPGLSLQSLSGREDQLVKIISDNREIFDSLWTNGVLLEKFIGEENTLKFRSESDSAYAYAIEYYLPDFNDYSVRIVMPGSLTATNGYPDSTRTLLWPVKSDFFAAEDYVMWAESKTTNRWAWIVTAAFIVFVFSGVVIKKRSR